MGIGTTVRHRLGRLEIPAAELYRRLFVDLDAFAAYLKQVAAPDRILEIGCGDGVLARRLCATFPEAHYLGIDPAPAVGRLYRGRTKDVEIRNITSHELAAEEPEPFDLVILCDVLHHIDPELRTRVLADAGRLTSPAGKIAVKEWTVGRPVLGELAFWADRYVSGDRNTHFMSEEQLRGLLDDTLPGRAVEHEARVGPWKENLLLVLRRGSSRPPPGSPKKRSD